MNVTLLRKVAAKILEEPKQFDMSWWFLAGRAPGIIPNCGTAACIAGWGIAIDRKISHEMARRMAANHNVSHEASKAFGLHDRQADCLFSVSRWPERFRKQYKKRVSPLAKAKVAVARIEHFIKTEGRE